MKRQKIKEGRNPLLELCVFCGEPAELFIPENEVGCKVMCGNSKCPVQPVSKKIFASEELAIKAWNTHKGGI